MILSELKKLERKPGISVDKITSSNRMFHSQHIYIIIL